MVWIAFGMAGAALAIALQGMEHNKKLEERVKELEKKL